MHYPLPQPGKGKLNARQNSFFAFLHATSNTRGITEALGIPSPSQRPASLSVRCFRGPAFPTPGHRAARRRGAASPAAAGEGASGAPSPRTGPTEAGPQPWKPSSLPTDLTGATLPPPPTQTVSRNSLLSTVATADLPKGAQAWQRAPAAGRETGPAPSYQRRVRSGSTQARPEQGRPRPVGRTADGTGRSPPAASSPLSLHQQGGRAERQRPPTPAAHTYAPTAATAPAGLSPSLPPSPHSP